MKRHIIVYYGKQNSGKTTTLTLLHNMLAKALPQCNNPLHPVPSPDFRSLFCTKGYVICIDSGGAETEDIQQALEYFEQHRGHILFIAARPTNQALSYFGKYIAACNDIHVQLVYANQCNEVQHEKNNRLAAGQLFTIAEGHMVAYLFNKQQQQLGRLLSEITKVRQDRQSRESNTYVIYDTCAYRKLVNSYNSDDMLVKGAKRLHAAESSAGFIPMASLLTIWELVSHITETDSNGNKTETRIHCEKALRFIHHHVQGNFLPLSEYSCAIGFASNFDNPLEIIVPDIVENTYNTSCQLYAIVHSIESIIAEGESCEYTQNVKNLANDLIEFKKHINTSLQSCIDKHQKPSENVSEASQDNERQKESFINTLQSEMAEALLHGLQGTFQTVENYKKMFPVTYAVLHDHFAKWHTAINSGTCGPNWAMRHKLANTIIDALQLSSTSPQPELNATLIITEDRRVLQNEELLTSSNHKIISLEEHKQQLGI